MSSGEIQSRLELATLQPETRVSDAIAQLDKAGTGALLLCDPQGRLQGLLTDGDIRRAILRGDSLELPSSSIATQNPVTASAPISPAEALQLMNEHDINQLPVLGAGGQVKMLLLRKDLVAEEELSVSAVVMAGGYGTRLRPLTDRVPKPMLPVGNRPLLELTLDQLRRSGIRDVNLATHYLPETISDYFGDGGSFGVRLNYLREEHPLGTAGGLKLLKKIDGTMLVINGDILTGLRFREMFAYHRRHGAELTVGVRKYEFQVPFGVVESQGVRVQQLKEKPMVDFLINAGTYLLEPSVHSLIPADRKFDMTDLIQRLIEANRVVVCFPIVEYWLDVGRHEDYQKAQEDVLNGRMGV